MSHKNIVLIGFMGSGKTLISKELAKLLKIERVSTDEVIETRQHRGISRIFQDSGEAYFRALEAGVIAELALRENIVIDCGGGVILNKNNLVNLRGNGMLFYLKASPSVIFDRIKKEGRRPILDVPDPLGTIEELLEQREYLYQKADHTIDVDSRSIDDIVHKVIHLRS